MKTGTFFNLDWTEQATNDRQPRLPFSVEELGIESAELTAAELMRCIPSDTKRLKTLSISSYGSVSRFQPHRRSSGDFALLFATVGHDLRTFSFKPLFKYGLRYVILEYGHFLGTRDP